MYLHDVITFLVQWWKKYLAEEGEEEEGGGGEGGGGEGGGGEGKIASFPIQLRFWKIMTGKWSKYFKSRLLGII